MEEQLNPSNGVAMNGWNETSNHSEKEAQRRRLILGLLENRTIKEAAASAGISEATAWRIRQTPEFQEEYREARRELVLQSMGRVQQASSAAANVLLELATDPSTPPATRLQAACRILEYSKDFTLEEIVAKFARLEKSEADRKKHSR
jgi:hypothetical protein